MRRRILGVTGKRRRRSLLAGAFAILTAGVVAISALAVHDEQFQLDGNALSTLCGTTFDGGPNGPNACTTQIFDWGGAPNSIFNADTSVNTSVVDPTNTTRFTAAGFNRDFGVRVSASDNCSLTNTVSNTFCTADGTTYATGSKDTQNISGGGADQAGNWQCNRDNNVNSKIDIMNAYSAVYIDPANGDKTIYFALEKNKDNGNNNAGFWFLQGDADCVSTGGATNFTGNHQDGDLLVTSAYTSGGGVSSILVFRWAGGANGCIDSKPLVAPACDQLPIASGADCKDNTTGNDVACATTNSGAKPTNTNVTVPWKTADATLGVGNTVVPPDFLEGGINVTKAFQQAGGIAPTCFNTFIADTRSSQSVTATLFDFSRGRLGECRSTTVTTPTPSGSSQIPANARVTASDSALITVTGVATFSGSVKFSLCGPGVAASANCQTGGVEISTETITNQASPVTVSSDEVTLTKAGKYCWRAEFTSTTSGVPPSSDPSNATNQSECFTITPRTPDLATCSGTYSSDTPPVCTPAGTVDFGNAITDRAFLSGTANQPGTGGLGDGSINPTGGNGPAGGTITFKLYGPDTAGSTANCDTLAAGFPAAGIDRTVSGDGVYGPVSFTPQAPGVYHWKASYSGDLPNTNASGEHNSDCDDPNEDVTIRQIPTDIKTKQSWFPNDHATIRSTVGTDNLGAGGTVDFTLYESATCSGTVRYSERQTLAGGANSEEVLTHNYPGSTAKEPGGATVTPFRQSTAYDALADSTIGPFSWKVVYTPAAGDSAHLGSSSTCTLGHTEKHSITYTNDPGN